MRRLILTTITAGALLTGCNSTGTAPTQAPLPTLPATTLAELHGHCLNATDTQIAAFAGYGTSDLAKYGITMTPTQVADQVAIAVSGAQIDCQGAFAAYLVTAEAGKTPTIK